MPAAERELWGRWRDAAQPDARAALLSMHLPYARTVAATYYGRRMHDEIEFDDYLQYARIGLIESIERFDPGHGVQFRTYAARRMHGAILDGLERFTEKQQQISVRQRLRRERLEAVKAAADDAGADAPRAARAGGEPLFRHLAEVGVGMALCRLLEGTGMVDLGEGALPVAAERHYESIELAQVRRRLAEIVDRLNPQQRTVIRYHYLQENSFEEVARMMGVTRGRVSQIHRQALAAMRAELAGQPGLDLTL